MILCFISVILKVCLIDLLKSLFCSIVRMGTRKSWIFSYFVKVDSCAVAGLLVFYKGINLGKFFISFQVGMLMMFDSAPESIKKSISMSGV